MAQPYLSELQELLADINVDDTESVCKHFFSGAAAFANGKIVASFSPKGLAFKLSKRRCDSVLSEGIAIPLQYFDQSPVKRGYVVFPHIEQLSKSERQEFFRECVLTSTQNAA